MLIQVGDTCAFGGVTFGQTDSYGAELYFLDVDGWGAPQSTVQLTQRAAADGGFASPAYLQGKVFTVRVAVVADTRAEMVAAIDRATAAAPLKVAQPITISQGGYVRAVWGQRQDEIGQTETSDVSVELTFTFACEDPRKLGTILTASTGLPSSSGGLTIPFTVPFSINSTVVTGQCSLTNPGLADGAVTMLIDGGSVTGPSITHAESGLTFAMDPAFTLIAGNTLSIDMDNHLVLENEQADRATFVTSRGWSPFLPGGNTWTFAAAASTGTPMLTVSAYPAWT